MITYTHTDSESSLSLSVCSVRFCMKSGQDTRPSTSTSPLTWSGNVTAVSTIPQPTAIGLLLGGVQWKMRRCSLIPSATKEDSCTSFLDNWASVKKCQIRFGWLVFRLYSTEPQMWPVVLQNDIGDRANRELWKHLSIFIILFSLAIKKAMGYTVQSRYLLLSSVEKHVVGSSGTFSCSSCTVHM